MRRILAALALLSVAALAACGGSGDKAGGAERGEQLTLALALRDPFTVGDTFAAAVSRLSGGSIRISVRGRWREKEVDHERGIVADVTHGKADLGIVGVPVWDTLGITAFRGLLAPFLVDGLDLQRRLLRSSISARLLDRVEPAGVVGVALLPGALRRPLGFTHPLVRPGDYRGATVGMRLGGIAATTLRTLGATAKPSLDGSADLDGAELDLITIADNFMDTSGRTLTANVVLWPRMHTIVMNPKAYERLTQEQRDVLRRAGREAAEAVLTQLESREDEALAAICARGDLSLVTASPEDLAALRGAVRPVYTELRRDGAIRRLIEEVTALRRQVSERAVVLRCPGRARPEPGRSQLDGRWLYHPTRADLLAAGLSPRDSTILAGTGIFVFAAGRFEAFGSRSPAVVASGRYSVDGDVVSIVFEKGPVAQPEHAYTMRWNVYRDVLTFSAIPGRDPLLAFVARPFVRTR